MKMSTKSKGVLGLVVRVSDVAGRDKKGDRFISPTEQIRIGTAYAQSDGWEVEVIEPMDLDVLHTTPLDERPAMGDALCRVETGELKEIVVSSQDRLGTLALTHELKARLREANGVLKVADNPAAEDLSARLHEASERDDVAVPRGSARGDRTALGSRPRKRSREGGAAAAGAVRPDPQRGRSRTPRAEGSRPGARGVQAARRWRDVLGDREALRLVAQHERHERRREQAATEAQLLKLGIGSAGWATAQNIPGTPGFVRNW
jgi:hypothetical protein